MTLCTMQFSDNLPRKLVSLRGQMTAFVKRIPQYSRNPATHLLVIMISTEDRRRKPYALPVQCLSYHSLKDAQTRKIANKVVQAMTKKVAGRGKLSMYIAIHCFYNLQDLLLMVSGTAFVCRVTQGPCRCYSYNQQQDTNTVI